MSGVVHAVGKVFSGITHAVGHIVHEVATHWQEVALAAAAVFTVGTALGVWGGTTAAAAAAGSGGFTALSNGGALLANGSGLAGASGLAATGAGSLTAGELAGSTVAPELAVGGTAAAGSAAAASGLVAASLPADPYTSAVAATSTQGASAGSTSFLGSIFNGVKAVGGAIGSGVKDVATFMGGGKPALGMGMLVKTAFDAVGAYMTANPPPPRNFGGFGPNGGAGLGMHTTNGGFGLAAGGSTPAPSGVPNALLPPPGSATPPGAGLSNAANLTLSNNGQAPANIGQTVANNAGVGGLVPQGAVNFNQPTVAQPAPTFNPAGGAP